MSTLTDATTCPLLSLPAELRLRIYEYTLCPTSTLCLTTTSTKRHAILPQISPTLLGLNKQINSEAQDLLLAENEITIVLDAHDIAWPIIPERRLPQPLLRKLKHVCFVLDCTSIPRAEYDDVDFTALEAMTSLLTLRLTILFDSTSSYGQNFAYFNPLKEILSRIPSTTKIICDPPGESTQIELMGRLTAQKQTVSRHFGTSHPAARSRVQQRLIEVITKKQLEDAVKAVDQNVRGSKSGRDIDIYATEHVGGAILAT